MTTASNQKTAALITGASAGLGWEFAKLFAADGHNLILVARRRDRMEALAEEIRKQYPVEILILDLDLEKHEVPSEIQRRVKQAGYTVTHLVNNAGFGQLGEFSADTLQRNLAMIELNVRALVELTGLFLPEMIERNEGHVLNLGSTAGFQPGPYMATYYASKAFVNSWSEALSYELRKTNVKITLSCPGATLTEFGDVSGAAAKPLFFKMAASAPVIARQAYRAMKNGRRRVIHGAINRTLAAGASALPNSWALRVVNVLQGPN